MKPIVSVIIVNWNTSDLLKKCLTSLISGIDHLAYEILVIDNGSTDNSIDMVRTHYPQVILIANEENKGFAFANNQGLRIAQGDYFLLLNTDAFLYPGCLERMVQSMEDYPDTGALGCKLLYVDGSLQRSCQSFPTLATELWQVLFLDRAFPQNRIFGKYRMTYWSMTDFREVDSVMGAVMLLNRKALNQVGLLDESYFMYSEEVDLCYRLKKNNWKVRYLPEAQAVHLWGGTSKQIPAKTLLQLYKSRVMFFRKHYGKVAADIYRLLLYIGGLTRFLGGYCVYAILKKEGTLTSARNYRMLLKNISAF